MAKSKSLQNLYIRDGGRCHYCSERVLLNANSTHPLRATRDHIVPRFYGGESHPRNYVLACAECNSGRNHDANVCNCERCGPLLSELRASNFYNEQMFKEILEYNKPVVKKVAGKGWKVYIYRRQYTFDTWAEALAFARAGKFERAEFKRAYVADLDSQLKALSEKFNEEN